MGNIKPSLTKIIYFVFLSFASPTKIYAKTQESHQSPSDFVEYVGPAKKGNTNESLFDYPADFKDWPTLSPESGTHEIRLELPKNFHDKKKSLEGPPSLIVYDRNSQKYDFLSPTSISSDRLAFTYKLPQGNVALKAFYWEDENAAIYKKLKKSESSKGKMQLTIQP